MLAGNAVGEEIRNLRELADAHAALLAFPLCRMCYKSKGAKMKSVRLADWSKDAFRTALFMSVFMLIISLLVGGINWLIWGSRFDKELAEFILLVFCVTYFTEAINSVHQRPNEVEEAVRSNSGKQSY